MQAIQLCGPEVMTLREVSTPVPAAGQVLVNMRPTTNGLP